MIDDFGNDDYSEEEFNNDMEEFQATIEMMDQVFLKLRAEDYSYWTMYNQMGIWIGSLRMTGIDPIFDLEYTTAAQQWNALLIGQAVTEDVVVFPQEFRDWVDENLPIVLDGIKNLVRQQYGIGNDPEES